MLRKNLKFFFQPGPNSENGIWSIQIFASIFLLSHNILQGKFEAKLKKESESDIFLQILSEIIILLENGCCGGNLAQISNWHLYMEKSQFHPLKQAIWGEIGEPTVQWRKEDKPDTFHFISFTIPTSAYPVFFFL